MSTLEINTSERKVYEMHRSQLRLSHIGGSRRGGEPPAWNILRLVRLSDHDHLHICRCRDIFQVILEIQVPQRSTAGMIFPIDIRIY